MIIKSAQFGELEVTEDHLIRFPDGIPGFPEEKSFVYIAQDEESPFSFLQSVLAEHLMFLLVDPFTFFKDYEFVLEDEAAEEMNLSPENPPQVFLIATIKETLADMTVNMMAPIVINPAARIGRQVVLHRSGYSVCEKLFPNGLPSETKGGE
ncbi:flagellar assembly protein FliW [Desulfosporosinus sp. PR]|uniref:flagellar assembly protein FliW n=1 Tax=Candidatus Desulfosporosinus nitrosoreducens TaxID=3401928 RepID=UPI0027EF6BCA|nr:flagellar assembly protein FliW [Desulfosporosinus sp. PR]MDQ7096260.1 flagellar assembly protein FliW [Desulfosporosinus sp. PR]